MTKKSIICFKSTPVSHHVSPKRSSSRTSHQTNVSKYWIGNFKSRASSFLYYVIHFLQYTRSWLLLSTSSPRYRHGGMHAIWKPSQRKCSRSPYPGIVLHLRALCSSPLKTPSLVSTPCLCN